MAPASHHVPVTKLEKAFVKAAEASGRMPSVDNRRKAREAYEKLPANSPFKGYKFEG